MKRLLPSTLLRFSARARAACALAALGGPTACSPYPTFDERPIACDVESAYAFDGFDAAEVASDWWDSADPLGAVSFGVEAVEPPGRCGSQAALVVRSEHCNDWGAIFGRSLAARDASAWEGLSFWARAPGATGKAFTILLDDPNTDPGATPSFCKDYGTSGVSPTPTGTPDPAGSSNQSTSGAQPMPDACGNGYAAVQIVTGDWRLYTLPFERFTQTASPNRVPNAALTRTGNVRGTGLITAALASMKLRMPKESRMELWIDNLSFYRRKAAGPAGANP